MRTTSYLALSRQAALERHMADDREQPRQRHDHRLPRRAHGVRADAASRRARRPVAFVQDVGLARDLAPGPITQTGNRSTGDRRRRLPRLRRPPAATRYGRAGRLEIDAGRPAGEMQRPGRCSTTAATPILLAAGRDGDLDRRRRHGVRPQRADRPDRRLWPSPTSRRCGATGDGLFAATDACVARPTGNAGGPGCARRLQRPAGPGDDHDAGHRARVRGRAAAARHRARARAAGDRADRFARRVNHAERCRRLEAGGERGSRTCVR